MPDDPSAELVGRVEGKVAADLEALISSHPMGEALSEVALSLGRKLDGGIEDKSVAGVARELRATLVELAKYSIDDEDDLDDELSRPTEADGP